MLNESEYFTGINMVDIIMVSVSLPFHPLLVFPPPPLSPRTLKLSYLTGLVQIWIRLNGNRQYVAAPAVLLLTWPSLQKGRSSTGAGHPEVHPGARNAAGLSARDATSDQLEDVRRTNWRDGGNSSEVEGVRPSFSSRKKLNNATASSISRTCYLQEDPDERHPMNQAILYNSGESLVPLRSFWCWNLKIQTDFRRVFNHFLRNKWPKVGDFRF